MKHSIFSLTIAFLILSIGIRPEVTHAQRRKLIHQAAVDGDVDSVKKRLDEGVDINEKNRLMLYTPLHGASRNGRIEVVKLLIERGADLNATEKSGMTPLMLAVQYNHKEIVELLLAKNADINAVSRGNQNAYTLAKKGGNAEIVDLLANKGAKEPEIQDRYGEGIYEDDGISPPRPGGAPRPGMTPNVVQPPVQIDLLADPNEITARIKTFAGMEKIILELGKKSAIETRYWAQTRYDNRTSLIRSVQQQFKDEMTAVRKIAVEEKATKTTKAIDDLLKKKEDRYSKIKKELMQQRREAMASGRTSSRSRGRSRGSSRSSGRGYSTGSSSGGYATGGAYAGGSTGGSYGGYGEGNMGMSGRGSYGRTTARPEEQLDRETQEEIRHWTQATPDKKLDLAKAIHPITYADFALIRKVAVEEEAKKTTAAIDGILLARQVRFDVYVKMTEALMQAAAQDPRLTGQPGNPNMQPGTTRRGRGTPSRTTGRRRR